MTPRTTTTLPISGRRASSSFEIRGPFTSERPALNDIGRRPSLLTTRDGAVCLRNHMEVLPLTDLNLDFYHLSEHVHAGKRSTFGEKSKPGEQWAGEVLHAVRHEGYEPFWDQLTEWRGRQRASGKRRAANGLMHYAAERKDMVNYRELEQRGCHIGTGAIESMCKVVPLRVKGPGMRWDSDNAEAMMALETLEQSNLWDRYWTKALQAVTYRAINGVPG